MAQSEKDNRQDPIENIDNPDVDGISSSSPVDATVESAPEQSGAEEKSEVVVEAEAILAAAEELEQAKVQAAEWQDKYLRLHAEWDTYRRRTDTQRKEEKARATEKLMGDLLPVLDDFERTVKYAEENGETGLLGGVVAVQNKLSDMLAKHGLVAINPLGEAFDALEGQAVGTVEDDTVPDETVHDVYQRGYKMGGKVLRPAMVTVTTGGPKRVVEDAEATEEN